MTRRQSAGTLFTPSSVYRSGVLVLGLFFSIATQPVHAQVPAPPLTRQDNVIDEIHGLKIVDPYRWLEEQNSEETHKWVAAENAYTHSLLDGLPLRAGVSRRLMERLRHDTMSAPWIENGYYFFTKKDADQDLSSIY